MKLTILPCLSITVWSLMYNSCLGFTLELNRNTKLAVPTSNLLALAHTNAASMTVDDGDGTSSKASTRQGPLPPGRSTRRFLRFFCDDTMKIINPTTAAPYQSNGVNKFGSSIFKTNLLFHRTVFVVDEKIIKKLSEQESAIGLKPFLPSYNLDLFGAKSVLAQSGPRHSRLRRLLQPSMSPTAMKSYEPIIRDCVQQFFRKELPMTQEDNQDFRPMVPTMRSFFIFLTLKVILGAGNIQVDIPALAKDIELWSGAFFAFPLPFIPWSKTAKAVRAKKRIVQELNRWMDQDDLGSGLLAKMIAARDDGDDTTNANDQDIRYASDNRRLSRDEIIDNLLTVVFAGSDTTASAAISMWKILSVDPSLRARLLTASTSGDDETIVRFVEMILESYPPGPFNFRMSTEELDVGPYHVPADWLIVYGFSGTLHLKTINRDWIKDLDEPQPNPPMSLAFGSGQRKCPGRYLATMELEEIVKELVRYDWELKKDQNLDQEYNPTLFPKDGLLVKV